MGRLIPFRLRPGRDDDIAEALDQATVREDRSHVIRAALRAYLLEPQPVSRPQVRPEALDDITLEGKEKDDTQLGNDLDALLGDF